MPVRDAFALPDPEGSDPATDLEAMPAFLRGRPSPSSGASTVADPSTAAPARPPTRAPGARDARRLPVAMFSRRQVVAASGLFLVVWMSLSIMRQVGDAAAASGRADGLRASNGALRREVAGLTGELATIGDPRTVDLQARAYGLGASNEIRFALQADAPPLGPDAAGSASVRLGAPTTPNGPLESWLRVLFGP